jgi:adenosylcobinamide-phosphate synthase
MSLSWEVFRGSPSVLCAALFIDLAFGELPSRVHPVVWMGRAIQTAEKAFPSHGRHRQFACGALLAFALPIGSVFACLALVAALEPWPAARWLLGVLILTAMFAGRALGEAASRVRHALEAADIGAARSALPSLCSRDASALRAEDLVGASVESLAENASDSWVAPLFYYALFGLPGAVFYRAVNTLDAMVGYHGRYEWLGKTSARVDDVLNFVPARLTAVFLLVAGALRRTDVRRGLAIWRRDARTTESPNAGRPMATMAGLLGVRLEKAGHYSLGDAVEPLTPDKILSAWRIVQVAGAAAAALAISILAITAGLT